MASRRRQRRNSCTGKVGHASRDNALIAARKTVRGSVVGDWMHAYRCPHCGKWHIGHPRNQRRRKRRAEFL